MAEKSKILFIGATISYKAKVIIEASVELGHTAFALVPEGVIEEPILKAGATALPGEIDDHESLVKAIKKVDVVISTVLNLHVLRQHKIIKAITQAGNVKRFLPSEFGRDFDRSHPVEPAANLFREKAEIRRAIETAGIPYTYIVCYGFGPTYLPTIGTESAKAPPTDRVEIMENGNTRVIMVAEKDIITYTLKAVDDPRTLNQILYIRPPANILSFNNVVSKWERKLSKSLQRITVTEEQLLQKIQENISTFPEWSLKLALMHSAFVKGEADDYDPSCGVEATQIYPEVEYITVDRVLDNLLFGDADEALAEAIAALPKISRSDCCVIN